MDYEILCKELFSDWEGTFRDLTEDIIEENISNDLHINWEQVENDRKTFNEQFDTNNEDPKSEHVNKKIDKKNAIKDTLFKDTT